MKTRTNVVGIFVGAVLLLGGESLYSQSDTLRFAFVSDLHFGQSTYLGEQLTPDIWLRKALAGIERKKADFIFLGGDLITSSNSIEQYAMFDSVMVTATPWYPMAGNHDISEGASATLDKIATWIQRSYGRGPNNREYYGFVKKGVGAFFVLNTQAPYSTDPAVKARADSQLVEMDAFFTANAAVPNKFVCSHVPLFITSQLEDSSGYFALGPWYRSRVIALMNKHNAHSYLAGHRHEHDQKTDGAITVYTNTALSFQLGTGNQRGYYIYTVTAGSLKRDFYPLSLEPDAVRWKWIAYGDTRTNDAAHRSVLQSMKNNTPDYKFIINVGDDVEDGTNVLLWNTWQTACDQILGGTGQSSVPPKYMTAAGNHEKLEFGGLANWRTFMSGQVTQFGNDGKYFTFDYEDARFVVLYSETENDAAQQQYYLDAIKNNPKKWLFAVWHKPIFDFGPKVYEAGIHQNWGAPFYQNGGDIIFMGHAHQYVRTVKLNLNGEMNPPLDPINGTTQVITGNGGAPLYPVDENSDGNGYMVAYSFDQNNSWFYGYTELTVDGDTLYLRHFSANGVVMDEEVYYPNHKHNVGVHFHLSTQTVGSGEVLKSPSDSTYPIGSRVVLTAVPALGWKFDGWSGDLTGLSNPDTVMMDTVKNITATFSEIPAGLYEIRIHTVGTGTVVTDPAGPYFASGSTVTLLAKPDWDSKLDSWSGDLTGSDTSVTISMDGHKSVTATFRKLKTCLLNVRPLSHGSVTLDPSRGTYVEGSEVQITAVPETGWEFHEWLGDVNGTASSTAVTVNSDLDVRPVFRLIGGGLQDFEATHDTYIQGSFSASRNFNADSCLRVREGTSDLNRYRAYVQFDVQGIVGNVLGAVVKMRARDSGLPDGSGIGAGVYEVSVDGWTESTLKWTGAPAAASRLDTMNIVNAGLIYGWDVGSYVTAEAAGDKVVSVMFKDFKSMDKRVDFERREDGKGPVLTVLTDMSTGVEQGEILPTRYALKNNYPNPFNPETTISFEVPKEGWVSLKVYDVLGKEVATLVNVHMHPGVHRVRWNAGAMPTGVYICRMTAPNFEDSLKIIFMK